MKEQLPVKLKRSADEMAMVGTTAYYHNILKQHPKDQQAYERLMVLYRQQKEYKKELQVIDTALKIFAGLYAPKKASGKKIRTISDQLNKALGLVDKKGKAVYEPKPLSTWRKRRETVLKKIKAS